MARSALQKRRRAESRREILDAARAIVIRDGPGAMTLSSVAKQVGLTTPALYYYFSSKEALLQALVESWVSDETDMLVELATGWREDEAALLGGILRGMYDHYRLSLSSFRLVYLQMQIIGPASMGFDAALLERLHPYSKRMFDALEQVLRRGQARGTVSLELHARTACVAAHAAAVGLLTMLGLVERVADPLKQSDRALLNALSDLFLRGARPRGERPAPRGGEASPNSSPGS